MQETQETLDPWVGKIPWRRKWQPTPVFLLGESHRQRNLVGYSPWDCKSQTWLSMHARMKNWAARPSSWKAAPGHGRFRVLGFSWPVPWQTPHVWWAWRSPSCAWSTALSSWYAATHRPRCTGCTMASRCASPRSSTWSTTRRARSPRAACSSTSPPTTTMATTPSSPRTPWAPPTRPSMATSSRSPFQVRVELPWGGWSLQVLRGVGVWGLEGWSSVNMDTIITSNHTHFGTSLATTGILCKLDTVSVFC